MTNDDAKLWYKSRMLWFNLGTALVAILMELSQLPDLADYGRYILLAVAVINILLRTMTTQPLTTGATKGNSDEGK